MRHLFLLLFCLCTVIASAQSPQKTVLFEKITSAGCGGCAYGDFILDSLEADGINFIPVHIHWHNATHIDSMTTAAGDSILTDYLVLSPSGMIDRVKFDSLNWVPTSFLDGWRELIQERYLDPVYANVWGEARYDSMTRMMEIDVAGEFLMNTSGDIRVNAYVLENGLTGSGDGWDQDNSFHTWPGHPMEGMGNPMTNYTHNHVLTYTAGGPWGEPGIIPPTVNANDTFAHTFQQYIDPWVNDQNLEVVVLVQRFDPDKEMREILNAAMAPLDADTGGTGVGLRETLDYLDFNLYPNPANDQFTLSFKQPQTGAGGITNLVGQDVQSFNLNNQHQLVCDVSYLQAGIYFVWIEDANGKRRTKRLRVH